MQEVIGSIPFTSTKEIWLVVEKIWMSFLSDCKKSDRKFKGFDPIV